MYGRLRSGLVLVNLPSRRAPWTLPCSVKQTHPRSKPSASDSLGYVVLVLRVSMKSVPAAGSCTGSFGYPRGNGTQRLFWENRWPMSCSFILNRLPPNSGLRSIIAWFMDSLGLISFGGRQRTNKSNGGDGKVMLRVMWPKEEE